MKTFDVVIVGGGHGGAQAAIALRQVKFTGTIAIVGEEPDLPYERPPLSKEYFSGHKTFERILIRPAAYWADRGVELLLGAAVTEADPTSRVLTCADGSRIGYEKLIWATGGRPRTLTCPGAGSLGVFSVRTRADVDRLAAACVEAGSIVIIGGGYIGLEAAAVLSKMHKRLTLLEMQDRVLARVAGEPLSRFFESEHKHHGVDIRLGIGIERLETSDDRVTGVRLTDGEVVPANIVVVGIGIIPAISVLLAAGAEGATGGVLVDATCRTSLPDIYAIGDCASHINPFGGPAPIRLESVQNATDQATVTAKNIVGDGVNYDAIPMFWSHQFDLKLQTAGLSGGHDDIIVRGSQEDRSFSVIYLRDGMVTALDCVNAPKDFAHARKLIGRRGLARDALGNRDNSLRDL